MDKRAKGERDEDSMAEMIIRLLGKRNEPFIFGFENHFSFPLVFPPFPLPIEKLRSWLAWSLNSAMSFQFEVREVKRFI